MKALFIPLAIILSLIPDFAEAKYNVCSATLNSSDEIDTFKKTMGSKNFNYVELTTLPEKEDGDSGDWLDRACAAKIQCDILIVSGHFGGSFFGSSGLSLPMETMEQAACKPGCDGIFKKPKEVYLMGCNTLAGKDGDTRTPEQYRAVLVQDGFDNETADQIVAFRYSAMGTSYADRMRGVFSGVPRIYGFDSIAPAGKNVKDLLSKYFKEAEKTGYYSKGGFLTAGNSVNNNIKQALKVTNFAQAEGIKSDEHYTSAACFLGNPEVTGQAKLKWIEEALTGPEMLAHLPYITKYFESQTDPETGNKLEWTDKTFEQFENTAKFAKAKAVLHDLVMKPLDSIISVQAKAVEFQDYMGWLKPDERQDLLGHLLLGDEKTKWSRERADSVRSALPEGFRLELGLERIPNRFDDPYFREALISLKPKDPQVIKAIVNQIAAGGDFGDFLNLTGPSGSSPEVQRYLASLVKYDVPIARQTLEFTQFTDPEALQTVQNFMLTTWKEKGDSDQMWEFVQQAQKFPKMPDGMPEILQSLAAKYTNQSGKQLPSTCIRLFYLARLNVPTAEQIEKWPALISSCPANEARGFLSLMLNWRGANQKTTEEFLLAALKLYPNLHENRSLTDDMAKALGRFNGPFTKFDPAFKAYVAGLEARVTGPDTIYLQRMKYFFVDRLGNTQAEKLALADALLADKDHSSYDQQLLESPSADTAMKEKVFRAKWEENFSKTNNTEEAFRAVVNTPSLIAEFMPKLLDKGLNGAILYAFSYREGNVQRIGQSFATAPVLKPYLAMLSKLHPKSDAGKKGLELLNGLKPADAAAVEALRAAIPGAEPELAEKIRSILIANGDEPTRQEFLKTLTAQECGVPQEIYFSSLARFFQEPLTKIARAEVEAGVNEEAALPYLISLAPDKPESEPIAAKYIQMLLNRRAKGGADWLTPELIMGLDRLVERHPGEFDALLKQAFDGYKAEADSANANRHLYLTALLGVLARGLPGNSEVQSIYLKKFTEAKVSMDISLLLGSPTKRVGSLSPEKRQVVIDRLRTEKDPSTASDLVSYLDGRGLSLAEKNRITEVVRQAPEAARQRWFEDTGHR